MPPPHQPGLFDTGPPSIDTTFAGMRRIDLDATSWVEFVPGWPHGSDQLFDELVAAASWEQRERWMFTKLVTEPRLTAEYPDLSSAPQAGLLKPRGRPDDSVGRMGMVP